MIELASCYGANQCACACAEASCEGDVDMTPPAPPDPPDPPVPPGAFASFRAPRRTDAPLSDYYLQGATAADVQTIVDRTGNGHDLIQNTGALQPLIIPKEWAGWDVIRFDGVNDRMDSALFSGLATSTQIFILALKRENVQQSITDNAVAGGRHALKTNVGHTWALHQLVEAFSFAHVTAVDVFVQLTATFTGNNLARIRVGGVTSGALSTNIQASNMTRFRLGCNVDGNSHANFDFVAWDVYNGILSGAQIAAAEVVLLSEYL